MEFSRRALLKSLAATSVGAAAGLAAYGTAYERHHVARLDLDLPVVGLPPALDGLRVGIITDIHHGPTVPADDVVRAVQLVKDAAPDLIVLGGDYVTAQDRQYMSPVAELMAPLAHAPQGSFAVLGNHDDDKDMPALLAARGFSVLKDQRTALTIRGERVDLAGIRFWTKSLNEIARVLRGTGGTTLLLAHDPRRLAEAASLDVQLVLSGHTHGGQVIVPGFGAIAGRKFPVLSGYATRDNTSIFVSKGVGTVYVPIRINCPPDVAILTLRRKLAA
jgi:predicted MPP superfamily phosphohydrolase